MDFLPVFLTLRERRCVVVGGGHIAERKLALLLRAGARVEVVAPTLSDELLRLAAAGHITTRQRAFVDADVDGAALVIAATDAPGVNEQVAAAARRLNVPVNVVDQPEVGNVVMPSIVDRSPVVIAIGTGGNAPVLARMLRAKLESLIPQAYGELASLLGSLRERVRSAVPDGVARRRFWERTLDGPAAEMIFAGRRAEALASIERGLAAVDTERPPEGEVYLIGTGPGDPDLLTFRALRLMQNADVVVYDRLIGDTIVDLCRRDAERIYVGKSRDRHAMPQAEINQLLVRLAKAGKRAARLKGGDPFVFGRGGEEIEDLAAAGVAFQVVPGITAALGCAAYAGIPLTHRDLAHSCAFVTGHHRADGGEPDWAGLVRPHQTLVFYMGASNLDAICASLVAAGMDSAMPAAVVERGTTLAQRVVTGTLDSLPALVRAAGCQSPLLIIVGAVVGLRDRLKWFEQAITLRL
ncbi:MAG: uroporphyrinogen-III C-methyltransferase [Proteobacteria bacterium]|jgi:uroporphyrin-III C-methyltransferase/precorrin-2 dehydrogenase/sirohydrochlorin ferrochelatase|nr:uroporphyrinogen-III C-methyltransferase [Pseudomonadota bacterium]